MTRLIVRTALICLAGLGLTMSARGDSMPLPPPVYDYAVTFPSLMPASSMVVPAPTTSTVLTSGLSSVTMTGDSRMNNVGSTAAALVNLQASSTNATGNPDTFAVPYSFTVSITDHGGPNPANYVTQTLTFSGVLNGSLTSGASNFPAMSNPLPGAQSTTFGTGGDKFTVTLTSFVGPNLPASDPFSTTGNVGGIGAFITVVPGDLGNGHVTGLAPEPSSLLLCSLGGFGCLAALRKRLTRRAARA